MIKNEINFPDINIAIEGATSTNEICSKYIDMLNETKNICNNKYANKLSEFLDIDEKIPTFEDEFHIFKKFLRNWSKKNNINMFIKTRKKDFIGLNEKIQLFYPYPEKVHDLAGFRLILRTFQYDTIDSIKLCYQLMNEVLYFFVEKRKYTILEAEELIDIGEPDSINSIIIPRYDEFIIKGFENNVKDYIRFPKKKTAYQSLHCCIMSSSGLVFEIQIRTFAMDIRANHESYKRQRYSNSLIDLDYSKITLPGIAFNENNELIYDNSGLLKGSDLFNNI